VSQGGRGQHPKEEPWEHAEAHTKPRGTPVGDRSPEDGRSFDDGKPSRRNRQEGRTRETVAAPTGGKASKWESRERCREGTLLARFVRDQTVKRVKTRKADRAEPQGPARIGRAMCCGDAKPQESHRELTQLTRRPVREYSKGRSNARRDADPDERCPERTKEATMNPFRGAVRRLTEGESRGNVGCRRSPESLKAGLMPYEERIHD
jgi:hypothetical protein